MSTTELEKIESLLIKTVKLIFDDQYGTTEAAYESLMELVYNINPNSKALEYLAEAQNYKGRMFLDEDFELEA